MKTAGFPDFVDGVLDPCNLISCMRCSRSSTPVKVDGDIDGTNGGESNDTASTFGNSVSLYLYLSLRFGFCFLGVEALCVLRFLKYLISCF